MMNRVEDNQLHLLHVWISVFCQILLIYKNIDDFGNEIITGFAFVIFRRRGNSPWITLAPLTKYLSTMFRIS